MYEFEITDEAIELILFRINSVPFLNLFLICEHIVNNTISKFEIVSKLNGIILKNYSEQNVSANHFVNQVSQKGEQKA